MNTFRLAALCAMGLAASNAATAMCYTVMDRDNRVIYHAQTSPVDMSRPLHETMPQAFPGGHLVFDNTVECPVRNELSAQVSPMESAAAVAAARGSTPLLTDRRTAQAMGLPHTPLGNNIVMVRQRPDNMRPGMNVIAGTASPGALAAAPSLPVAAAPAPGGAGASDVVITEMYDPPLTAVQRGGGTTVMGNR